MDGTAAIHFNLEALKRILAGLVGMAGLGGGAAFTSPLWGGRREASGGGCDAGDTPTRRSDDRRPPHKGEVKPEFTLPRHLRLAILRLLRPAESAARRLIIASASGLVVTLPPPRQRKPRLVTAEPFLRRFGIAVVASPADLAAGRILPRSRGSGTGPRVLPLASPNTGSGGGGGGRGAIALPLCDPPRRFRPARPRTVPPHAAPRIMLPGIAEPYRLPPPPSPNDPVDATRLNQRLAALAAALDDIEGQARRFARWKARRSVILPCEAGEVARRAGGGAADVPSASGRTPRTSPLRPGRPPGGRLSRYDPDAYPDAAGAQRRTPRSNIREVDEILAHAHALALYALRPPDTS